MAPTQLIDFSPNITDMFFAISQKSLNESLSEYLTSLKSQISWAFDVNSDNGELNLPANPTSPNISFSGTLAPPASPASGGTPVWTVDLSQAGTRNQVTLNLTFANGARFTDNQLSHTYVQPIAKGDPQWVVAFQVEFKIKKVKDETTLPSWLQKHMTSLRGKFGQVFDISQVALDLTTLSLSVPSEASPPSGFLSYDWTLFARGTLAYLQSLQWNPSGIWTSPPSGGYAVTYNGNQPAKPLGIAPTEVDFVILPNSNNPAASTLVLAFKIDGIFTSSSNTDFADVTLISDPTTTPGIAFVKARP
ncbi:hypothetical protein F53441_10474 [Fusarium austroafricanum]|uniref:Uncharacterized protein n=1 Tax=Fusarium austroafricanum TaxID=2364996 RepID=A0A8H4NP75_9HYPO|nr:hypothetical protein F53441_10474 [Fusarium austroafricanum]